MCTFVYIISSRDIRMKDYMILNNNSFAKSIVDNEEKYKRNRAELKYFVEIDIAPFLRKINGEPSKEALELSNKIK